MSNSSNRGRYRYTLIIILAVMWVLVYLQRTNIGVLLVDQRFLEEMGLVGQAAKQGMLMTAFLLVYSLSNMLSVPVSNRLGPRRALFLGVIVGALSMLAGGWVACFGALILVRVILGLAHGIYHPNISLLVKNWIPAQERGTANAVVGVGGCLALIVALPLYSWINSGLGWEYSFIIPGLLGLLAIIPLGLHWVSDQPTDNPYISAQEAQYIVSHNQDTDIKGDESAVDTVGVRELLKSTSFWLMAVIYTAFLCSWWGLMTWMPQYLVQARNFDISGMAGYISLAYAAAVVGILTGGRLADRVVPRSVIGIVALCGVALATLGIALAPSPLGAVVFMALAVGINEFVYPALWAIMQTSLPAHLVVTGSGIASGVGNLLSAVSPFIMGWLIQVSGSYTGGLLFLVSIAALGAVCCIFLYRLERQEASVVTHG
ncbi:MAG: MFS transporter [Syntrophomonadaceae bacterium]|nr:MFS transporter [Syntrophomonadaceae bacterium]